jgi:sugar phosphate isomerase/epimerase
LRPEVLGKPAEQASIGPGIEPAERRESLSIFVESLKILTREAADLNLGLLVENNVISPEYIRLRGIDPFLMTTAAEIDDVFARVGAPNLRLLLDVAHARVSATALGFDPGDFVQRVKPYVGALHLSDNDGQADQNLPIREDSWFWPHLRGLSHLDAVIEVYEIDDATIRSQIELVRRQMESPE